eukprot:4285385-Karenia_brevis.AAC.1
MIERFAEKWISSAWVRRPKQVRLIMDYERCLRQDESLQCLRENGFYVQPNYPVNSADLNAIEMVWAFLRQKLESEAPEEMEACEDFIRRLHGA